MLVFGIGAGLKLQSVTVAASSADSGANPDGKCRVWRREFDCHLIAQPEFRSGEHGHAAFAERFPPTINNQNLLLLLNYDPNGNIGLVSLPSPDR